MPALFPSSVAAENFAIGQPVRWYITERQISPYVGIVIDVYPGIQKVDVLFPIGGRQQRSPEELIPLSPYSEFTPAVSIDEKSNNYSSYQSTQYKDYVPKGVSGVTSMTQRLASSYKKKVSKIFKSASTWYNYGLSREEAQEKLLSKYSFSYGEAPIKDAVNVIYNPKFAATKMKLDGVKSLIQDALNQDPDKKQKLVYDVFAIVYNSTGSNVFTKSDDLITEACSAEDEESFLSVLRRGVGRAGGDFSSLVDSAEAKETANKERYLEKSSSGEQWFNFDHGLASDLRDFLKSELEEFERDLEKKSEEQEKPLKDNPLSVAKEFIKRVHSKKHKLPNEKSKNFINLKLRDINVPDDITTETVMNWLYNQIEEKVKEFNKDNR